MFYENIDPESVYDVYESSHFLKYIAWALLFRTIKNKALISLNVPSGSDWTNAEHLEYGRVVKEQTAIVGYQQTI